MKLPGSERQRKWASRLGLFVALGVAYYLFTQVLDLESVLEHVANALGSWTYALVAVFAFAETGAFVGLIVPGETVMILGGAVAGQGATNLYVTIALAWLMAWLGDTTSFFVGRPLGREFLQEHGPRFGFSHERLEQVEDFFARHGGKTIFIGRWIGFVRAFAPFIAGSSGMCYRAFVPYSVLGCGLWVGAMVTIGYVFSRSIDTAITYAGKGAALLGTLIVIVVVAVWLTRFLRERENRRRIVAWMEDRAATRPLVALGRRYQRQLRFLGDRVTPGRDFGLEFTSLLAALAVGLFVLVAYIVVVGGDPGPTPGDETAIEVAEALRCGAMTTAAKVLSAFGSGVFVWTLTFVCAAALAARRRWTELGVLVAGMALTTIGFHEAKAAVDRPRPAEALIETSGSSFPSGHAANSVLYVWLAVTIVVRLRPGMARAALVVVAGVALTALIGVSRVYLGAHYLSDVSGGWALGAAAFSISALAGLLISQVRHNPEP